MKRKQRVSSRPTKALRKAARAYKASKHKRVRRPVKLWLVSGKTGKRGLPFQEYIAAPTAEIALCEATEVAEARKQGELEIDEIMHAGNLANCNWSL